MYAVGPNGPQTQTQAGKCVENRASLALISMKGIPSKIDYCQLKLQKEKKFNINDDIFSSCGTPGVPGIYARVTSHVEWINDVIDRNGGA